MKPLSDELLQRYFDDELGPAERTEVEANLDGEARLRLEALAELRGLLRAQASTEAADVDLSSTIAAIERAPAVPAKAAKPRRRLLPMSAIGGLLAAAAAFAFFLRPVDPAPGANAAQVETLEVQGAIATVFRSDEDDGTIVIWAEPSDEDDEDEEEEEVSP